MQMPSQAPPSEPPPAKLLPGMGSLHHAIATTSPEAQKFFDQGLTLVYAFNFLEAYHSFQRAAELDPREPMPHWGAALALGPNYNAEASPQMKRLAYREISKATELAAGAPQNEKDYVQALAQRYSNAGTADQQQLANDYAAAMRGLSRKYPADPDAATLYAQSLMQLHPWRLWTAEGKPRENTEEIVAVLENVLRRWPEHVGANHLYIHALEASPDPERALPSAKRLETLVPGAGHLVHMPSHIYIHTGDYAAAVKSNEDAAAADRIYLREREIPNYPYVQAYVDHNFYFLVYAAMMDGQFQTAARAAEQLATDAAANPGLSMSQGFMSFRGLVLLRYAGWDAVLKVPTPDPKMLFADFYWHFARGCALAAKGQPEPAETERQAMEETYKQIPAGPEFDISAAGWEALHRLAAQVLDARIATAKHDNARAIEHWRQAVAIQDAEEYSELPEWYYPVRESLGAALLRNGQALEAEEVFRQDLKRNRLNPRSLFGLWKCLEAEKNTAEAQKVHEQFNVAWRQADSQLAIEDF
jgi:tetratricopeptide (TPR) repeat protein